MKSYQKANLIVGWVSFLIATVVYLLTIEPTASLWDCGEFLATNIKLEVGHPPGAPVFMIVSRVASLLAGGDTTQMAKMVNGMSALASSFTILFLFWTITHLAKKILMPKAEDFSQGRMIAILAAGFVGAMAYTFSDSFWFSAVEAEVYAMSSLFTAVVFWAILKWENVADQPYSGRWLILIAYLVGLSMGVHLLNLLAIPAIVFVFYFKRVKVIHWKGIVLALGISVAILALVMYGILPGVVTTASRFELFFVNQIGLPYNSGAAVYVVLLVAFMIGSIWYTHHQDNPRMSFITSGVVLFLVGMLMITESVFLNLLLFGGILFVVWYLSKKNRVVLNTIMTSIILIMIGYSSFTIIKIRSHANPPIDENNPENFFNLLYYLNREQYGDRPLFYGEYYNSPEESRERTREWYAPVAGKYEVIRQDVKINYDDQFKTLFPRMWSRQPAHVRDYKSWADIKGRPIRTTDEQGNPTTIYKPTFGENLKFFFRYQVGWMYMRYFMWNFSGKQSDTQSHGSPLRGNWISGIGFIDNARLGDQSDLPASLGKDPTRNQYYLLPFFLGIFGLVYQFSRSIKDFWVVLLLFLMTGLAVVVYLNQYPQQPRERDYAYAASFYAYAIWIGFGVLAIFDALRKLIGEKGGAVLAGVLTLVAVPALMASENWDDHDRSGRSTARVVAYNYLNSCDDDAILFTNGDNDTFPLWYGQEVEGFRTDVRVVNLMLANAGWYIEQMKFKAYESDPLPLSLPDIKYRDGTNGQVFIVERIEGPITVDQLIDFIGDDSKSSKIRVDENEWIDYIPCRTIRVPVDKQKVLANGTVKPEDADLIVPYIDIQLTGNYILKSTLMVLDLLATNDWERPMYYVTGQHEDALGLEEYMQLEGFAYRLVPIKSANNSFLDYGRIDSEILYKRLMEEFIWDGLNDEEVFLDYYHRRTLSVIKVRNQFTRLAEKLIDEGKKDSAVMALDFVMETLPHESLPYDFFIPGIIEAYYNAGDAEKADALLTEYARQCFEDIHYYQRLKPGVREAVSMDERNLLQQLQQLVLFSQQYGEKGDFDWLDQEFRDVYSRFVSAQ